MSVLHPVGPLPPRVYWVRRLLAVVAVLLVLLLAAWAWGALTGGGDDGAGGTPEGSQSSSPQPTSTPSPTPSGSPSSSPQTSPSPSPTGTPKCADAAIVVTATSNRTSYPAGQDPRFTVKVTNTSKKACQRDVGQKAMEVRVGQGNKQVWSSDDCAPGGEVKLVTLDPGESFTTSVIWSRTTSKAGCPGNQPEAAAGTYALTGRNLTVVSQPVAFALD